MPGMCPGGDSGSREATAVVELALIAVLATASGPSLGSVHGTVRSEGTDEPIPGVEVTLLSGSVVTTSDTDGAYVLPRLPAGPHRLRFSQFGYHDLTVEVMVPEGGELQLDVRLRNRPIAMPAISVLASPGDRYEELPEGVGPLPPGSRILSFSALRPGPLGSEPDALLSLEGVPGVDLDEESPTGFHVRGGSADQNLVLLDGVPVYNAQHTSSILSGINPDAVSAVALHAGALPARYGGRLSSAVDLSIPRPGASGLGLRGGLGPADLRSTVETRFPRGGGLLLGGRRTTYDIVERGDFDRGASSSFEEFLAKASMPAFGGELDLLSLHSNNWLAFFADVETMESEAALYSPTRWTTNTDAATWRWSGQEGTSARAMTWKSGTHSRSEWSSLDGRLFFVHSLNHLGLQVEAARVRPSGASRAGLVVERVSTSYTAYASADNDLLPDWENTARFESGATSATAYLENRWIPHDQWLVDHGARVVLGAGGGVDLEPRLSVHYRPHEGLALSAGYARVHQYAQSLRNEESALNAALGLEPLVSAADPRVPVGRSDQVTGAAELRLGESLRLELDAYARWLDGLVLVAPATAHPFAVEGFEEGRGRAQGVGAALVYRGSRTDFDLVAEWASATRSTDRVEYRPAFERQRSLSAAVSRRLGSRTRVRAAFRAVAGRPTSPLASGFRWEPFDPYTGEIEFGGTPIRLSEELNRERLPAYVRLDAGVRRTWRPSIAGRQGSLVTWLDVRNVLGRRNVLALLEQQDDLVGWYQIPLTDTSLAVGVQWAF